MGKFRHEDEGRRAQQAMEQAYRRRRAKRDAQVRIETALRKVSTPTGIVIKAVR